MCYHFNSWEEHYSWPLLRLQDLPDDDEIENFRVDTDREDTADEFIQGRPAGRPATRPAQLAQRSKPPGKRKASGRSSRPGAKSGARVKASRASSSAVWAAEADSEVGSAGSG
eukprot:7197197-Alexandrium_andersonii.AAC.1